MNIYGDFIKFEQLSTTKRKKTTSRKITKEKNSN